ncbi:MAG: tetratricopeptide repeat protein [Candidatus Glassbacteria bacterium]|nr:tetratricopeptide repeat protein [Candidatus Glassbacteria bacterium]
MNRQRFNLLLYVCFLFSGASGLAFEVLWMRKLTLVFGNTVHAVSTVVAVFMGGLALGSWLFGRWADRSEKLLRTYILIELGIAASGAAISLGLLPVLDSVYVGLHGMGLGEGVLLFLVRFLLSAAIMLVPTALMGGTLPVIGRYLVRSSGELGARIGTLYGLNTAGAVAGVLATGFWLIMLFGETTSVLIAACGNLIAAVLAVAVLLAGTAPADPVETVSVKPAGGPYTAGRMRVVPLMFAISGFAALAFEVLWTRALIYFVGLSVHAFTIILTCFLAGIALGSLIVTPLVDRFRRLFLVFGTLQWVMAVAGLASLPLIGRLNDIYQLLNLWLGATSWNQVTLVKFVLCLLVLGVPTLAMGAAFPVVNRLFISSPKMLGRGVGTLYAANTVGTILGSLAAGVLLLPLFGISGSIVAVSLINSGLAFWAVRLETGKDALQRRIALAGPAALVAVMVWVVVSGSLGPIVRFSLHNAGKEIIYVNETTEASVAVLRNIDGSRELNINGESTAYTGFDDIVIHKLLSHLPILFHEDPRSVLVVGFGFGSTLYTATRYDLERIECVELVPEEASTAAYFLPENHGVLDSPDVKIVFNDGRNLILTSREEYDIISFNAIHPKLSPMLYTHDFYKLCRRALKPDGTICAWLPTNGLTLIEFKSLLRSFVDVFPQTSLWWCNPANVILLGTSGQTVIDYPRWRSLLARPKVKADLREVFLDHPLSLASLFMMGPEKMQALTADAPLNTDSRPVIEFSRTMAPTVPMETYRWMIDNLEPITDYTVWNSGDAPDDSLDALAERIGYWYEPRIDFYEGKFAAWVFQEPTAAINLYRRALAKNPGDDYIRHFADPRPPDADSLISLARQDPDDFIVRYQLGDYYSAIGDLESARRWYSQVTRIIPEHTQSWFQLGVVASGLGLESQAERYFRTVLEINPASPQAMLNLGLIRYRAADMSSAEDYFRRAISVSPDYGAAVFNLGNLELRRGDVGEAERLYRLSLEKDPFNPLAWLNLGVILTNRGDYERAAGCYRRAIELNTGLVTAYSNLALTYEKMGRDEDAARYRELARRLESRRNQPVN